MTDHSQILSSAIQQLTGVALKPRVLQTEIALAILDMIEGSEFQAPIAEKLSAIDKITVQFPPEDDVHIRTRLLECELVDSPEGKSLSTQERLKRKTAIARDLADAQQNFREDECGYREAGQALQDEAVFAHFILGTSGRKSEVWASFALQAADEARSKARSLKPKITESARDAVRMLSDDAIPTGNRFACAQDLVPLSTSALSHASSRELRKRLVRLEQDIRPGGYWY